MFVSVDRGPGGRVAKTAWWSIRRASPTLRSVAGCHTTTQRFAVRGMGDSTVEYALGLESAQTVLARPLRVVLVEQLLMPPPLCADKDRAARESSRLDQR